MVITMEPREQEEQIAVPQIEAMPSAPVVQPDISKLVTQPLVEPPPLVIEATAWAIPDTEPIVTSRRWPFVVLPVALGFVLTSLLFSLFVLPIWTATATVLITPESKTVEQKDVSLSSSTGLPMTILPMVSQQESRRVKATGVGVHQATKAWGSVTFYNAASYTQTIATGELLTSPDGVQVETTAPAYLPAANPPVEGEASVNASSVLAGSGGNTGAFSGACCKQLVTIQTSDFTGGSDARTFPTPTKADISGATAALAPQVQQYLQSKLTLLTGSGNSLVQGQCTQVVSSDIQPGQEVTNGQRVMVTVQQSCQDASYRQSDLDSAATHILNQSDPSYILAHLSADILAAHIDAKKARVTLSLHLVGLYVYQFSNAAIAHIQQQLVGMDKGKAFSLLLEQPGIASVGITSQRQTLPGSADRIHILLAFPITSSITPI